MKVRSELKPIEIERSKGGMCFKINSMRCWKPEAGKRDFQNEEKNELSSSASKLIKSEALHAPALISRKSSAARILCDTAMAAPNSENVKEPSRIRSNIFPSAVHFQGTNLRRHDRVAIGSRVFWAVRPMMFKVEPFGAKLMCGK